MVEVEFCLIVFFRQNDGGFDMNKRMGIVAKMVVGITLVSGITYATSAFVLLEMKGTFDFFAVLGIRSSDACARRFFGPGCSASSRRSGCCVRCCR
ncbi:hypothetical protein [Cohnella rhizosphaerae]|uniref:Uncharacterized protein n=1 Tax=Cohnella rhizosphaerae TaxID=1457232 RepID=A0A9X4KXS4_9BACL|nr:hypothetical protein [Cohnella rhizosphaerae]MDG0813244.1 hypothetical protein [Cohnella rhizosphaerae]